MPTMTELRDFIKTASRTSDCPQPSLSGNKAALMEKARKLGYRDPGADAADRANARAARAATKAARAATKAHARSAEITELKRQSDKIKALRKRQSKTTDTPAVIAIPPTQEQQNVINLKKQIKTVWKGRLLKTKVKPKVAPVVVPMWGAKSNAIRKNLSQTQRYWG